MQATETLEFLLVPLRGAPIVLIPIFSTLLLIAAGGGLPALALIVLSWCWRDSGCSQPDGRLALVER